METIIKDKNNNEIIALNDGKFIKISLSLQSEGRTRHIGTVDISRKTLRVERSRHKHLLNKANAYGFNHYVLKIAKQFDMVQLTDEYGCYMIPVQTILDGGQFLFFKEQGFEIQIFLPLSMITPLKVNAIF